MFSGWGEEKGTDLLIASSGYLSRPTEMLDGADYDLPKIRKWTRLERKSEQH